MLIQRLMKVALLGSEWVLYLLIGLSVLSISAMFERWLFFRRRTDDLDKLRKDLIKRLNDDDIAGAEKLLDKSPAIEARVVREALRWLPGGAEAMADAVDSELARLKKELERGTNLLGTLGNNAPFIGLFGTVIGVVEAFEQLGKQSTVAAKTAAVAAPQEVMAAIAEALVATAVGLAVAIPAVAAYNYYQRLSKSVLANTSALSHVLLSYLVAPTEPVPAVVRSDKGKAAKPAAGDAEDEA
jgi:biopolymer transport protein ExbB/biopolymer transport protein TolQ